MLLFRKFAVFEIFALRIEAICSIAQLTDNENNDWYRNKTFI